MIEVTRYEHFKPGVDGEREVATFWIAGPLKAIEARAWRENEPDGPQTSGFELLIAIGIAVVAITMVFKFL